jgi:hypothetical protein
MGMGKARVGTVGRAEWVNGLRRPVISEFGGEESW